MIRQLAGGMDAEVKSGIRSAFEGTDSLHGRTARAMEERLAQFQGRAGKLTEEIETVARLANAYAERLDQLDQELAEKL